MDPDMKPDTVTSGTVVPDAVGSTIVVPDAAGSTIVGPIGVPPVACLLPVVGDMGKNLCFNVAHNLYSQAWLKPEQRCFYDIDKHEHLYNEVIYKSTTAKNSKVYRQEEINDIINVLVPILRDYGQQQ